MRNDTTTMMNNPSSVKSPDASPDMTLRTLDDMNETIADPNQDIRGREVIAKDGDKIGKVDALLVDTQEGKIRFARLEAGGFLGFGEKTWLIPVDAITRIDADHVYVDQTRDRIIGAPVYDPNLAEKRDYYPGLYSYYGYGPYWGTGYSYPMWWGGV